MKSVIGGLIAIILGIFFLTLFFPAFLNFLTGIIPLSLIIGGGLALYLKHEEEATDTWDKSNNKTVSSPTAPPQTTTVETKPVATKPVETEPVEIESVEIESVEIEPVEIEPVETEPVEIEPVETEPVETEPAGTSVNKPTGPDPQLFGNTDSLVFHTPDCRYSKNKHCTAIFNTRENAIQEGYKPCGVCKP
jgi:hypothetical protein